MFGGFFPGISGASYDREYFGLDPIRCFVIEGHIRKVALAKSEMSPKHRDSHYNVSIAGQPHGKRQLVAISKSDPASAAKSSISPSSRLKTYLHLRKQSAPLRLDDSQVS
jgi:hypothetical protein